MLWSDNLSDCTSLWSDKHDTWPGKYPVTGCCDCTCINTSYNKTVIYSIDNTYNYYLMATTIILYFLFHVEWGVSSTLSKWVVVLLLQGIKSVTRSTLSQKASQTFGSATPWAHTRKDSQACDIVIPSRQTREVCLASSSAANNLPSVMAIMCPWASKLQTVSHHPALDNWATLHPILIYRVSLIIICGHINIIVL